MQKIHYKNKTNIIFVEWKRYNNSIQSCILFIILSVIFQKDALFAQQITWK